MDPLTKHTLFAMAVGYIVTVLLELPLWPSVALGILLAVIAQFLARRESNQTGSDE
jgi:mannose/fructose/N-acetylgalactosamine-specific phosphotransferase system component IIC